MAQDGANVYPCYVEGDCSMPGDSFVCKLHVFESFQGLVDNLTYNGAAALLSALNQMRTLVSGAVDMSATSAGLLPSSYVFGNPYGINFYLSSLIHYSVCLGQGVTDIEGISGYDYVETIRSGFQNLRHIAEKAIVGEAILPGDPLYHLFSLLNPPAFADIATFTYGLGFLMLLLKGFWIRWLLGVFYVQGNPRASQNDKLSLWNSAYDVLSGMIVTGKP